SSTQIAIRLRNECSRRRKHEPRPTHFCHATMSLVLRIVAPPSVSRRSQPEGDALRSKPVLLVDAGDRRSRESRCRLFRTAVLISGILLAACSHAPQEPAPVF